MTEGDTGEEMVLDTASHLHLKILRDEIDHLKSLIRARAGRIPDHDTGHIHTTINTLEWRVKCIKGEAEQWI